MTLTQILNNHDLDVDLFRNKTTGTWSATFFGENDKVYRGVGTTMDEAAHSAFIKLMAATEFLYKP